MTKCAHLAFLGHLVLVLAIVLSMGPPSEFKGLSRFHHFVALGGIAWLLAGLLWYARWRRKRTSLPSAVVKSLLVFYSVTFTLLGIEITSRIFHTEGVLYAPGSVFRVKNDSRITPGIATGEARFSVNEVGLRGPSLNLLKGREDVYRIIAIGGSTTECFLLDDTKEWPHLLMQGLNRVSACAFTYVSNAGLSGKTTVDHRSLLESHRALQDAEMYIFLVGVNDLTASIALNGASSERLLQARTQSTFATFGPYYTRLLLYRLVRPGLPPPMKERASTARRINLYNHAEGRTRRAAGPWLPLPNLTVGLREYRERIGSLADLCAARGKRCLFLTQPVMWRGDLTSAEESLLWFGNVGTKTPPDGYVRTADLARGMDTYNRELLDLCRARGLECFDLASVVPRDVTAFYDDCHFNEGGARIVSDALTAYLHSTAPFNPECRK